MYRIESDTFTLELCPEIYEEDLAFSENITLGVKVNSCGYSVETSMDVSIKDIARFAMQLDDIYESLGGEAKLDEPYSNYNYIEFISETGGHISVGGRLNNCVFGHSHEFYFENEINQTYLKEFVKLLVENFNKYIK
ncbi:MAG: hypothetical protein K6F84_01450 [Lachnospiraceae bacterium]|nr:hypothetical protein [Lachnospiraceae bacterium]